MKKIGRFFLQGLIAILPIILTIYILYRLSSSAEFALGKLLRLILPDWLYIPGMGVVAGFFVIVGFGLLLNLWLFRKIFRWGEVVLEKIPLVKSLYSSIKDLTGFFDTKKEKSFNKVVKVNLIDNGVSMIGLVTREDFDRLPEGIGGQDTVAVYLPWSYQVGGFTILLPKSKIKPIDMSIEDAMRFCLTAGVSTGKQQ